jgi:hypothetical protein
MGVVVGDLLLAIVLVTAFGLLIYKFSSNHDRTENEARRTRELEDRRKAELAAKRYLEGIPLICLNCESHFVGPLGEDGCPNCHSSTLVVTEEELRVTGEAPP